MQYKSITAVVVVTLVCVAIIISNSKFSSVENTTTQTPQNGTFNINGREYYY